MVRQSPLTQSLIYNKLTISCKLSNTVLKVKNSLGVRVLNGCQCISRLLSWLGGLLGAAAADHDGRSTLQIASMGKDQDWKCEVQFLLKMYHFRAILKSKTVSWPIIGQRLSLYLAYSHFKIKSISKSLIRYFHSFFILSLWNLACILYSQHISIQSSHISNAR